MVSAYIEMWKNIFTFSGRTERNLYWKAVACHIILMLFDGILGFCSRQAIIYSDGVGVKIIRFLFWILFVICAVGLIPWFSMSIRRLRDAGRKESWMFTLLIIGIGFLIVLFLCAGCTKNFEGEKMQIIQETETTVVSSQEAESQPETEVVSTQEAESQPETEVVSSQEAESLPETEVVSTQKQEETPVIEFDPADNIPEVVYGPPEWFE